MEQMMEVHSEKEDISPFIVYSIQMDIVLSGPSALVTSSYMVDEDDSRYEA